jgi:hypothetical protein
LEVADDPGGEFLDAAEDGSGFGDQFGAVEDDLVGELALQVGVHQLVGVQCGA